MILESWLEMETDVGGASGELAKVVQNKMPKRVKKRKETGEGWEEYFDYIFPDDLAQAKNLKIL
jgi:crooked neck